MSYLQQSSAEVQADVQLVVYDLSRGMAKGLSSQFLGPDHTIEVIPHTGVVVYGREYFFGGGSGIQSEDPQQFRMSTGMHPFQILPVGRTTVTQRQFESWCLAMMQNGSYAGQSYDLLERNCNNFSHDALKRLGFTDVFPAWILDVPRRFLSSPMGQMIRPMLQNMQLTAVDGAETVTVPPPNHHAANTSASSSNPWAQLESTKKTIADRETPTLDSFTKPLLSSDKVTLRIGIQKIAQDDAAKNCILQEAAPILLSGDATMSMALTESVSVILLDILESDAPRRTFALMLLRLVVLRQGSAENETLPASSAYERTVEWMYSQLRNGGLNNSPASLTMAWLTASNLCAKQTKQLNRWVEAAIHDLANHQRPEVRQATAALIYNASLLLPPCNVPDYELSDSAVAMLCAALDGIKEEQDDTTKLRLLAVIGRIVKCKEGMSINHAAKNLVADLGFADLIAQLSEARANDTKGPSAKCKALASDLRCILQET